MTLLILECTPKKDRDREGLILFEFLSLNEDQEEEIEYREFEGKQEFLKFLSKDTVSEFDCVHLSGHGSVEDGIAEFQLPHGSVQPDEFPEKCFTTQQISLSACELGRAAFIKPFIEQTQPDLVIAPMNEVPFRDAALFWVNYYDHVIYREIDARRAFDSTKRYLKGKITGGFQLWENND